MHCRQGSVSEFRLIDIEWVEANVADIWVIKAQRLSGWNLCEEDGIGEVLTDFSVICPSNIAAIQPFLGQGSHAEKGEDQEQKK
jgi:hypothetical protein